MPQAVKFPTTAFIIANGQPYTADQAQLKNTWRAIGTAGYAWSNHFRFEVEGGYTDPKVRSFNLGGVKTPVSDADVRQFTAMGNLLYDMPITNRWSVTVGGGGGWNWTRLDLSTAKIQSAGLTWQGIGGITYKMSEAVSLQADYRYITTSGLENFDPGHRVNLASHNAMLSLRWYMDRPAAPPPPPPAPPPPPPPPIPPPPPPVTTYIVFFDFNAAELTQAAQRVISEAVKAAKTNGFVKVQIVGHTDTVGSDAYNMALSLKRAQSVKEEMVREGLDGTAIGLSGQGFHDLLVPTGPGVREPQNRRAVIDLGR